MVTRGGGVDEVEGSLRLADIRRHSISKQTHLAVGYRKENAEVDNILGTC